MARLLIGNYKINSSFIDAGRQLDPGNMLLLSTIKCDIRFRCAMDIGAVLSIGGILWPESSLLMIQRIILL
jgi:hypothetical protein